jgi:hypothetical protein
MKLRLFTVTIQDTSWHTVLRVIVMVRIEHCQDHPLTHGDNGASHTVPLYDTRQVRPLSYILPVGVATKIEPEFDFFSSFRSTIFIFSKVS